MMNKKIVAILITVLITSGLSADRCYNDRGRRVPCHGRHVAERTGRFARDTARGAGETAANILTLGGYSRAKEERRMEDEDEYIEDEDIRD